MPGRERRPTSGEEEVQERVERPRARLPRLLRPWRSGPAFVLSVSSWESPGCGLRAAFPPRRKHWLSNLEDNKEPTAQSAGEREKGLEKKCLLEFSAENA